MKISKFSPFFLYFPCQPNVDEGECHHADDEDNGRVEIVGHGHAGCNAKGRREQDGDHGDTLGHA